MSHPKPEFDPNASDENLEDFDQALQEDGSIIRVIHEEDPEDMEDSPPKAFKPHPRLKTVVSEDLRMHKLSPIPSPIMNTQSLAGVYQYPRKNQLVVEDANEDVKKNLTSPTQEALLVAIKESYEEMYNERLLDLESKHNYKINQLMKLVEDLKNNNVELREEIKQMKLNQNNPRGSSASLISDTQLKKLEQELEERFRLEMEEYKQKLEKETQEILMTKGITRERMREIEDEVREEFKQKFSQTAGLNSPRTMHSGHLSGLDADVNLSSHSNLGDLQSGTLEAKLAIRNEIRKKERLLEVRNKQKLASERKKLKFKLQEEFEQMKEDLFAQLKSERLELSRQKSSFNVSKKKLSNQRKELNNKLANERNHFQGVIAGLKKKLENTLEKRDIYRVANRVHHFNNNPEGHERFETFSPKKNHINGNKVQNLNEGMMPGKYENFEEGEEEIEFESSSHRNRIRNQRPGRETFGIPHQMTSSTERSSIAKNSEEASQNHKPLFPIRNPELERLNENFGENGSEIFENILQGEPRLLSHEILNHNSPKGDTEQSKGSTLTGVRRAFRKDQMVDLGSSAEGDEDTHLNQNDGPNQERLSNPYELKQGNNMQNLAQTLLHNYLTSNVPSGQLGVNVSEYLPNPNQSKIVSNSSNRDSSGLIGETVNIQNAIADNAKDMGQLTRNRPNQRQDEQDGNNYIYPFNGSKSTKSEAIGPQKGMSLSEKYNKRIKIATDYQQILNNPNKFKDKHFQKSSTPGYLSQRSINNQKGSLLDGSSPNLGGHHYLSEVLKFNNNQLTDPSFQLTNQMTNHNLRNLNPKILDLLFKKDKSDNKKTTHYKALRQDTLDHLLQDDFLISQYVGKIAFLSSDKFLERIAGIEELQNPQVNMHSLGMGQEEFNLKLALENWDFFKTLLIRLEQAWKDTFTSYQHRLEFLKRVEKLWDYRELCSRVKLEIEYLEDFKDRNYQLLMLMRKREMLKAQILNISSNFSKKVQISQLNRELSSQFTVLRTVLKSILKHTEAIKRNKKTEMVQYRGLDMDVLLKVDFWELEYLKKCEGRYSGKKVYGNHY